MKTIENIFDRMDQWRHFPSYQLERRADLYFALYLPEVLHEYLDIPIMETVIPEFPIRIGTIDENDPENNESFKVDYFALSKDGRTAILLELKTEMRSKRIEQDKYLVAAREKPFSDLLKGIVAIFIKTTLKRKYYCLLEYLENMGQLTIPEKMKTIIDRPNLQGITKASESIDVTSKVTKAEIVFVQPKVDPKIKSPGTIITFDKFRTVVSMHTDPVSKRFARSLKEWTYFRAGMHSREI